MKMNMTDQHLPNDILLENKRITEDTLGQGKLIEGDTLNILSKIDNDVVHVGITSPPYNKQEKNKGWLVKNVVYDVYKDVMPEPEYQQNQVQVLDEIYRVTEPGAHFFTIINYVGIGATCIILWIGCVIQSGR